MKTKYRKSTKDRTEQICFRTNLELMEGLVVQAKEINMVKTEFSKSAVLEMNLYICPAGVPEDLTFKLNQVFPAIFNKWSVFFIVSLSF